jgi:2-C-methyl-D-erythritol 2,4-cyclodiphosphate synthase
MRIGHGYDAHRFAEGRRLVLGGVHIPYSRGLLAHSDGDVVIHALCDALLGAAGLGDIGEHFPDVKSEYKDANSRFFLTTVMTMVAQAGWVVSNVDITIIAQAPKIKPFVADMKRNLAQDLGVSDSQVNIKATTTEGMGFTGRGEGMAAHAVLLLSAR